MTQTTTSNGKSQGAIGGLYDPFEEATKRAAERDARIDAMERKFRRQTRTIYITAAMTTIAAFVWACLSGWAQTHNLPAAVASAAASFAIIAAVFAIGWSVGVIVGRITR